jgi:hypothetical protein
LVEAQIAAERVPPGQQFQPTVTENTRQFVPPSADFAGQGLSHAPRRRLQSCKRCVASAR